MIKRAINYCEWATDPENKKVPKYVKLQCADFLEIYTNKKENIMFSEKIANKIEKLLRMVNVPKGDGVGKSVVLTLTGFQCLLILAPFCVVYRNDEKKRVYTNILLEIARKNAKSYVSGLIALILMILEPKFSRFFTVAPTGALAGETFRALKEFVSVSPLLSEHFKITKFMATCKLTKSEYTPLNFSTSTLDGRYLPVIIEI